MSEIQTMAKPKLWPVGALFKNATNVFTRSFKQIAVVALGMFALQWLIGLFTTWTLFLGFTENAPTQDPSQLALPILFSLLSGLINIAGAILLISIVGNDPMPIKAHFRTLLVRGPRYLLAYFLSGLIIAGAMLLFLIPGIITMVFLLFVGYAVVLEQQKTFSALKRSHMLVRGYWWAVFGRLLLIGLIFAVIGAALGKISEANNIASTIVLLIFSFILIPFSTAYFAQLFKNLQAVSADKPEPSVTKLKIWYTICLIVIAAFIFFMIAFYPQIKEMRQEALELQNQAALQEFENMTPEERDAILNEFFNQINANAEAQQ